MLLKNGADVNIAGGDYGSALGSASAFRHKGVIQMLLENGADVNFLGGGNPSANSDFAIDAAKIHREP